MFSGFGWRFSQYTQEHSDYSEIRKFLEWRNNKMKFCSYEEGTQMMRETSVINNLDVKDPGATAILDYINNNLKFMNYADGLRFLKGGNKS